ncbi:hypothetical protein QP166_05580 [Sphingomonas sp. LR60]|uniref:hypothetical protein n=1 Tax=Sphingomonas sp. LR60 TaxID=3050233 RepID=UPI002FE2FCDD
MARTSPIRSPAYVLGGGRANARHPARTVLVVGVGIAAALAGATAGTTAVSLFAPIDRGADAATSFGDLTAQEG